MQHDIFDDNDDNEVETIGTTMLDIKGLISIIEETLYAPKVLPNRKAVLQDYVKQLQDASLRLSSFIEIDEK